MALDDRYIVASDIEQYYVDKDTGLPLSNGKLKFFRDVARTTPKQVFQLSGAPPNYTYTSMGAVITLSGVGTVQNSGNDNEVIYYFPYDADGNLDLYYITVESEGGIEQFTREAWPNVSIQVNPNDDVRPITNQIANPQFSQVFINEGFATAYNVSAATNRVFSFAPDWDFVISGSGTVTVQRIPIAGNDKIVSSPPYVLDVALTGGITSCLLRQRFNTNSGLWASTATDPIFLSGTLIARNENASTVGIQMYYLDSNGGSPILIVDGVASNAGYKTLNGVTAAALPLSNNTSSGSAGYVDIYISFTVGSHVRISSLQVVPTPDAASGDFLAYDINSSNREQALMGDFYIPALNKRPTPSWLTAWDFPLNPFQTGVSGSIGTTAAYICDQTIALRGITGNVTFSRDPINNGLVFTTAGTNDAFYIMQYLSGDQAKKIASTRLSSNILAYKSEGAGDVTMRVYLFRAPAATAIPILPTSIGNLAADGTFTVAAANWTEIPRSGLDTAKAIIPFIGASFSLVNDIGFNGWQLALNSQINDTDKFAIVVTFSYIDAATTIAVTSISLTPGDIPCRPAPQTFDQVLRECQYYYEKSYNMVMVPGTGTSIGAQTYAQAVFITGPIVDAFSRFWQIIYNTRKRISVTPTIYSTSGVINNLRVILYDGAVIGVESDTTVAAGWTPTISETEVIYNSIDRSTVIATMPTGGHSIAFFEIVVAYHFVANARLGIV